ncbi:hypothetical protein [Blastopirellula retiformator]|uniref:Uncharacterized protein n=1 Tax=Blastopirellula retiformator TaxID=2527970 RepID=A0A5C5V491_9BACT|nr:hypothetical protein [Blastopirellula retiformator]TWT32783.1 hypothetical protein Enr8_25890 [Blastopirellula retiformator]
MVAGALVLCSVAVTADVRETYATPRQYYELITRLASPIPHAFSRHSQVVSTDGAKIELFEENHGFAPLSRLKEIKPMAVAELVVVPCPDRPDCVLAGYQVRGLQQFAGVLTAEACVLIDVANDRAYPVISSDDPRLRHGVGLPSHERKAVEPTLAKFAELLVVNIAEFPQQYGYDKQYNSFLARFEERVKVKVTCEVSRIDMMSGRATFYLIFAGGDLRERVTFTKSISELLVSKYALPIDQYLKRDK